MPEYRVIEPPARQRDWTGARVRMTQELSTGLLVIPAGRMGVVDASSGIRIHLTMDACECCKVACRWSFKPASYTRKLPIEFLEEVA